MPRLKSSQSLNGMSDDQLLDLRICDLPIALAGSTLQRRVDQLYAEMAQRGIALRPHCWLSDDWYSPDGVPGIAIPFYLAHARLMRLERKQMLEVEGGTHEWCMKILRHEAGHAIDTAYRLRRRRGYREHFGKVSRPYPQHYQPKPSSKRYVLHLGTWYAQSHPVEDFAETFAVWLRPRSRWRSEYQGWPALKKLNFVHETIEGLRGTRPLVASRVHVDPVKQLRKTLRTHYARKREYYGLDQADACDPDLKQVFSDRPADRHRASAAAFLTRHRRPLRRAVAEATGEYHYTIDQVLSEVIRRCRQLGMRLRRGEAQTKRDVVEMLSILTKNYLHHTNHRVAM
jgi:hypothetical protein